MGEKKVIFRPYTDLEGERRRGVEKTIQKLRWVEGFDSDRAWSSVIELGVWVLQHQENNPKYQEVYREFRLDKLENSKPLKEGVLDADLRR